jgi:hypothetical protein
LLAAVGASAGTSEVVERALLAAVGASAGTSEVVERALLAAVGVWDLPAILSEARASAAGELEIPRCERGISPGVPLRRPGRASQRADSPLITSQARV